MMTDALDRLRHLRDLLTVREPTPDLDRSIRQLMAELDRRDGPGAGEAVLWEVSRAWREPMEADTHG